MTTGTSKATSLSPTLGKLGPALVAGVAYLDPGNFASNLASGAMFKFSLVWVVLLANATAWFVQYLAAKLALGTGEGSELRRPLGIAIIGTVLANSYANRLQPVLADSSLPASTQELASESVVSTVGVLSGAVEQGMPTETAAGLQSGAFEAFLGASHVTMIISLVIVVAAALLVFFLLPVIHAPKFGDAPPVDMNPANADDRVREEAAEYPGQLAGEIAGDDRTP